MAERLTGFLCAGLHGQGCFECRRKQLARPGSVEIPVCVGYFSRHDRLLIHPRKLASLDRQLVEHVAPAGYVCRLAARRLYTLALPRGLTYDRGG